MVKEQDPEKEDRTKTEPQITMVKLDRGGATVRFEPKPGTVLPKRRRSVKSMILDSVLEFLCCGSTSSMAQKGTRDYYFS
ncbi:hypothetical protein TorRG33x02_271060 [Trema orientale]|uniref:Uncharacterized protein n=1 Tax=Trema orientale TaxID=63057 RepID=A0A2P5CWB8_TREOI|nr:hypothetical protein TorRG33x02_271060 [Trema orientale]